MNLYDNAKKAMRAKKDSPDRIRKAMSGTTSRTAGMIFDLSRGEKGVKLDNNRRAHVKAIELVSSLISSFALPVKPTLQYHGMIKNGMDNKGVVTDGIVRVGATIRTMMGHRANIEIPVIIRGKSLVEPAVFFYEDAPYVMCGPALDDLIKKGSMQKFMQPRNMFAPPLSEMPDQENMPRVPIMNQQHMFSPGSRNPWTFRRQSNNQRTKDNTEDSKFNAWLAMDKAAQHEGEPRERTNIDTKVEFPDIDRYEVPEDILDPAERDLSDIFHIGAEVVLTKDFRARERGGASIIIPKGERGKIIRQMCGQGKALYVQFPEMCLTTMVPNFMLRNAAVRKVQAANNPEWIDETLLVDVGQMYMLGAAGVDENAESGVAYYDPTNVRWQPWGRDAASNNIAESLNKEKWMVSLTGDSVNINDHFVAWNKLGRRAATIDQVRNEVKTMLREGYQKVDIKDAIQRKYPEHAKEALGDLNNKVAAEEMVDLGFGASFPVEMSQDEVFSRIRNSLSNKSDLSYNEFGDDKIIEVYEQVPGETMLMYGTIEVPANFFKGMLVGSYIEEDDGEVVWSIAVGDEIR